MSITTGHTAALGTAATALYTQPPGVTCVTWYSGTASAAACYIGIGTAGTAGSFALDPGGSVTFSTFRSSAGGTVSAIGGGSPVTVSWLISTAS